MVGYLGGKPPGAGPVIVLRVGVRACVEKDAHNVGVCIARGEERCPQRGVAEPVASVQVRSGFDQQRSHICMLLLRSEVQRGESFLVWEAHVVAVFIQVGGYVSYPALCGCVVQWRSSGSVNGGGQAVSAGLGCELVPDEAVPAPGHR